MSVHKIFNDDSFNLILSKHGFVKVKLFDSQEMIQITKDSKKLVKCSNKYSVNGELSNFINHSDYNAKLASNNLVKQLLCTKIDTILNNTQYQTFPVSHIVKPFGLKGQIWHQDSAIVDERKDISLNAWLPIRNSNYLNGCIWLIPGSHKLQNFKRQFGWNPITKKFLKKIKFSLVPIYVKRGEVLFFHRNMIHGSSINFLPWHRIALESVIVNRGAQFLNFHREEALAPGKIIAFHVTPEHFLKSNPKEDFYSGELTYELFEDESIENVQLYLQTNIKC